MNLLFHGGDAALYAERLQRQLPELHFHTWPTAVPCDYALLWSPPPELFEQQTQLRAAIALGAGVEHLLRVPTLPPDLPVYRIEDAGMALQMADYASWAVLRHLRRFDAYAAQQLAAVWQEAPRLPRGDYTVGVLGVGVLGRVIAERMRALGLQVRSWSRTPKDLAGIDSFVGDAALDEFLSGTDALIAILPLTAATENLLDRARLSRLRPGALVVNVGRGRLLVDEDLLALLDAGHLGGAVLDVFRQEPLPAEHPFWRHPKVVVTPHISARNDIAATVDQIAAKLRLLEVGGSPSGRVDRSRGY